MPTIKGKPIHRVCDRDAIVYGIFVDFVNGLTKKDVKEKLANNMYNGEPTGKLKKSAIGQLIADAYDLARDERESQLNLQRDLFWNRLTAVYAECMVSGDRSNALKALDMFAKYGAMYEVKTTDVQINTPDNEIKISFGFDKEND